MALIACPSCGEISKNEVEIYNNSLRKQDIGISPIAPSCKICGAEVVISHSCSGGKVMVINGTCGSGKTTVAEILQDRGCLAIDGDCAIQSLRHRKGSKQYAWSELIEEIAREMDILSLFGESIVISHVVLPKDLPQYLDIFTTRSMEYKFIMLKPAYQSAVERCRTRTCHDSVTPEEWIRHFYDALIFDDDRVYTLDNTKLTAEETADAIGRLPYQRSDEG